VEPEDLLHHHLPPPPSTSHFHHHQSVEAEREGCVTEVRQVEEVLYGEVTVRECRTSNTTECHGEPVRRCEERLADRCREEEREQCREVPEEQCTTRWQVEERDEQSLECPPDCWGVTCRRCQQVVRHVVERVPYLACSLLSRRQCRRVPVTECR
jgi:hypothetical protein